MVQEKLSWSIIKGKCGDMRNEVVDLFPERLNFFTCPPYVEHSTHFPFTTLAGIRNVGRKLVEPRGGPIPPSDNLVAIFLDGHIQ